MIEAQLDYFMDAIRAIDARRATRIEVRPEAQDAYNMKLQNRMAQTVWNSGGCSSWYLDVNGKNTTIYPDFTWRYRLDTQRFDPAAYELTTPDREPEPITA
jgi:hypothetical protein